MLMSSKLLRFEEHQLTADRDLCSDEESIEVINDSDVLLESTTTEDNKCAQGQGEVIDGDSGVDKLIESVHNLSWRSNIKSQSTRCMESTNSISFSGSWDFGETTVLSENRPQTSSVDLVTWQQSTNSVESEPVAETSSINPKSFSSPDGVEYIKMKQLTPKRIDQLTVSARIKHAGIEIKLYNEGCLLTADDNFVAKVRLESPQDLDGASDFKAAKSILLKQLRILEIFSNGQKTNRNEARIQFNENIERDTEKLNNCAGDYRNNYFQLSNIIDRLEVNGKLSYCCVCEEIVNNSFISDDWKDFARELYDIEKETLTREELYSHFGGTVEDESLAHSDNFKSIRQTVLEHHKKNLHKSTIHIYYSDYLADELMKLCPRRLFFINKEDLKLFQCMTSYLRDDIFQKPVKDIFNRWLSKINSLKNLKDTRIIPSTSPVFYDLCEYLEEVITTISGRVEVDVHKFLISDKNGWQPIGKIPWKNETISSKVLERGYLFLFEMLKHFDPSAERVPLQRAMQVLDKPEYRTTWKNIFDQPLREFDSVSTSVDPSGIMENIYVWYCLLDAVLAYILPNQAFESVIQSFIRLIGAPNSANILRIRLMLLIAEISPFLNEKNTDSIERRLLQNQLLLIESIVSEGVDNCACHFTNVIRTYWKHRIEVIERIPFKIELPAMGSIEEKLLNIILLASEKNVNPEIVKVFYQIFNSFLVDLNKVRFDWIITSIPTVDMTALCSLKIIAPEDRQTFRVLQPNKFIQAIPVLYEKVLTPQHYVIEIVSTLLSCIQNQLQRERWRMGDLLSPEDQLSTTGKLVHTIRQTLPYLEKQIADSFMFEIMVVRVLDAVSDTIAPDDFFERIKIHRNTIDQWFSETDSPKSDGV